MWSDGEDLNEHGEPIRLYQPILYSPRKFGANISSDPTFSHIGGVACYYEGDLLVEKEVPRCVQCEEPMCLLVQLHISSSSSSSSAPPADTSPDRTLYLFGCNKAACCSKMFEKADSKFCEGGNGVFVCRRSQQRAQQTSQAAAVGASTTKAPPAEASPWGAQADSVSGQVADGADNVKDWAVDDGDADNGLDDVEAMVAAMEVRQSEGKTQKSRPSASSSTSRGPKTTQSSKPTPYHLPCYEIHSLSEPTAKKKEGLDDDDVGMERISDDKIQQMLARYMAEEDDEEILAALRGSDAQAGSGGGSGRERDERMRAEDRAMLTFTDRVKREPRQILRYAKGGVPLWSVPLPKEPAPKPRGDDRSRRKKGQNLQQPVELLIPTCPCGAKRIFECQLMPSLLHVLDVDKLAWSSKSARTDTPSSADDAMRRAFDEGGMNWGAIAIYTCSDMCDKSREEFVIIQDSVDGRPEKRMGATEDAMVVEASELDDNDEEEAIDDDDDESSEGFSDDEDGCE